MHRLIRQCLTASATLALIFLLAACTISSDTLLVSSTEGVTPLPERFVLFPYEEGSEGYQRSTDDPASFVRDGNQYVSRDMPDSKGPITVRLLPAGPHAFLMAALLPDETGAIYGFARYSNGVLALALTPDDASTAALATARKKATGDALAALDDLSVSAGTGAITVKSRAGLDYLISAYAAGQLPLDKQTVAFIAPDAKAKLPKQIVADGDGWRVVP
jgi:hypothetical protein